MLRRSFNWRNWRGKFVYCLTFIMILMCCGVVPESSAATAVVTWSPSLSPDVDGHIVYYDTKPRQSESEYEYEHKEDCGDLLKCEISLVDQKTYYIAVRAYDRSGQMSAYSNEVEFNSNSASGSVVIVDNGKVGTSSTGSWSTSGGANPYGANSFYSKKVGATYSFSAAIVGFHEVSLWWTEWPSRSTSVPVKIYDGDELIDTVQVNQTEQGGQWNVLDTYFFNDHARVTVVSEGNDHSTCADAVRFDGS